MTQFSTRPDRNPPLAPQLRGAMALASVVLLMAGAGLFFQPEVARPLWPWPIGPFNAAYLGAVCLAACVALIVLLWYSCWLPARLLLPMAFVFAASVLLVSLFYFSRFAWQQWATWMWFALLAGTCLTAGYYLWRYRSLPQPEAHPTPGAWRRLLLANALMLGVYGLVLFLAPQAGAFVWPWPLDTFYSRLYSAAFTTSAAGALGLVYVAAPVERLALGVTYSALSLFAVFGVAIVDAVQGSIAWSAPGTWLWLLVLAAQFGLGLALIWWSSSQREAGA